MTLNKSKTEFIEKLSNDSGLDKDEIIELLKENFKGFNQNRKAQYYAFIMNTAGERIEKERIEKPVNTLELNECPLCGGRIFGTGLANKYTKEPKWECANNKYHYGRWRTNCILERKGLKPLSDKEWENVTKSN